KQRPKEQPAKNGQAEMRSQDRDIPLNEHQEQGPQGRDEQHGGSEHAPRPMTKGMLFFHSQVCYLRQLEQRGGEASVVHGRQMGFCTDETSSVKRQRFPITCLHSYDDTSWKTLWKSCAGSPPGRWPIPI